MDDKGTNAKVLVVDDEKTVRDFLVRLFKFEAIEVKAVSDGFQAIEAVKAEKFGLVFLDIRMPDIDGIRTYAELKKIDPEIQCVFMTGYALEGNLLERVNQQSVICLSKPFEDIAYIKEVTHELLKARKISLANTVSVTERRVYSRLDVTLPASYKAASKESVKGNSVIENISPLGAKVLFPEDLEVGTNVELLIDFLNGKTCKIIVKVVWKKSSSSKAGFYETGVIFTEVNLSELSDCLGRRVNLFTERKVR